MLAPGSPPMAGTQPAPPRPAPHPAASTLKAQQAAAAASAPAAAATRELEGEMFAGHEAFEWLLNTITTVMTAEVGRFTRERPGFEGGGGGVATGWAAGAGGWWKGGWLPAAFDRRRVQAGGRMCVNHPCPASTGHACACAEEHQARRLPVGAHQPQGHAGRHAARAQPHRPLLRAAVCHGASPSLHTHMHTHPAIV